MGGTGTDVWPGSPEPLGVTPSPEGVNVAIWSEDATAVDFCVFDGEARKERRYRLSERSGHVSHGFVPGIAIGTAYGFRVDGPWEPASGMRFNPAKLLIDPYARAIAGDLTSTTAVLGHRADNEDVRDEVDSAPFVPLSVVVNSTFDWQGDRPPATPWSDTVIYEAHVRGLTKLHPDVPEELRGTYAGLRHPAVLDHLVGLGVTAVELLPVHHHISELSLLERGLTNYWGYNSVGYFAPHAGYAASGDPGSPVDEFKEMVRDLHAAGLEVILDVVYNHTAEGGAGGPTISLRGIDNAGYYRLSPDGRGYVDYTGTGNTLNVPHPHVLRLIMDSLRYWVTEMHVDGFRFDLASALARSLHDVELLGTFLTTIEQDPTLRGVKLIAEPWDIGDGGYQVGEFPPLWTEWNDKYRDALRDFWRGVGGVRDLGWRLSGSADLYQDDGRRPFASINFVTAHDGFTLRDLVSYEGKHNEANGESNRDGTDGNRSANYGAEGVTEDPLINATRHRQLRNLLTTLFLSAGVPMIVAGDEFGRTQRGNNNAYCQDNEISWLDWDLADWQRELLDFAKQLGQLRRAHPVFRQRTFFSGTSESTDHPADLVWFTPAGIPFTSAEWDDHKATTIGMYRAGRLRAPGPRGEVIADTSMLLLLNSSTDIVDFELPKSPFGTTYRVLLDTAQTVESETTHGASDVVVMSARSAVLLSAD